MQSLDQQVTMVPSEQTSADISKLFADTETAKKVEIAVDNHEQAYAELARRTNLDKNVVLDTLFGFNKIGMIDVKQKISLPLIFARYFKGLCNEDSTQSDLRELAKLLAKEEQAVADGLLPKEQQDPRINIDFSTMKVKIRKGNYGDKVPYMLKSVMGANGRQLFIGASRPEFAVFFVFTNDKADVNNGVIYVRDGSFRSLKRVNTFEVNPFVRGKGMVTDPETGAVEVKDQLTFNPGWLAHTVNNMDRYIFAPLVFVPPKQPKQPKRHRVGEGEVDMNALIEKTLAEAKIDPAKAGEKVAEEVRTGIDSYAATAMTKITERDAAVGEDGIMVDREAMSGLSIKPYEGGSCSSLGHHDVDVVKSYPCTGADDGLSDCHRQNPPCGM